MSDGWDVSRFDDPGWTRYAGALAPEAHTDYPARTDIWAYISAFTFDVKGHLWVGTTYDGVREFDGESWITHYPIRKMGGSIVPDINAVAADAKGNVWVGIDGGLRRYDGHTWITYDVKDGLLNSDVSALAVDLQGNLWVGSGAHGVSRFDGQTWTLYTEDEGLAGNQITALTTDAAGRVWVATTQGISMFDGQAWTTYPIAVGTLASDGINAVAIDKVGRKWFGTDSGISVFDGQSWTTYRRKNVMDDHVLDITFDTAGQVWATMWGEGVRVFDGQSWRAYTIADGLVNNWVEAIALDKAGHLWFGTRNGVSEFDGQTWNSYTTTDGLADNFVNAVAIDNEGHPWFATENGVSEFDGQTWHTYTVGDGLVNNKVNDLAIDETGTKWFATESGISRFDGQNWRTYTTVDALGSNTVNAIVTDKRGTVWASTLGSRFNRFDGQNWTIIIVGNSGCSFEDFVTDEAGHQWFATGLCGVFELDDTSPFAPTGAPVEKNLPPVTPAVAGRQNPVLTPFPGKVQGLELVGHLGGRAEAAMGRDRYLYTGFGPELAVMDISNPAHPVRIGYTVLPGQIHQIALADHYAYVVDKNNRLWLIDITDPTVPTLLGFYQPAQLGNYIVTSLTIVDRYAYLTAGDTLITLDISNPKQPVEVSAYETHDYSFGSVVVRGNYVYAGKAHHSNRWQPFPGGLQILDISNPAEPKPIGFYELPEDTGPINRLTLKDHYAILVSSSEYADRSGVWVLDIADPTRPVEAGSYEIGETTDMAVVDGYVYLANKAEGLRVMDISDPAHLIEVDRVPGESSFVTVTPKTQPDNPPYLIAAGPINGAGLRLFDLSKPETPREFSHFETPAVLSKIVIAGNYVYVHYIFWENEGGEEIDIVDISNPAHPLQVGRYAAPPFRPDQLSDSAGSNSDVDLAALLDTDRIQDFAIAGDLMYVASGDCSEVLAGCQGNLRLVDISKPTSPHEIGVYEAAGSVQEVALNGDYAYLNVRLGEDNHTLHILDISQPTRPIEVGSYADQAGGIGPMAVIERKHKIYAYLARPYQGVDIIDVSDTSAPEKVSSWAAQENIAKLTILGDYAYFNSSILNIFNPIAPREIGQGEGTLHLPQADIIGIEKSKYLSKRNLKKCSCSVSLTG